MVFIITIFILAILHCIYLLCKRSLKTKNEASKKNVSKYKCPICGAGLDESYYQIQVITKELVWFHCGECYSSGNARMEDVINKEPIEVVSNPDDFRTWDIKNAKDVEFTKVTESFNRKTDLD
jgi:hypothetical protein